MKLMAAMVATVACGAIGACDMSNLFGKEVGRVPFAAEGTGKTTVQLAAGDVALWTDVEVSFEGDASLAYQVTLTQGDKVVASATCDPLADLPTKLNYVRLDLNEKHTRRGQGRMTCEVKVPAAGPTTVEATLAWTHPPASAALKRANLLIKQ